MAFKDFKKKARKFGGNVVKAGVKAVKGRYAPKGKVNYGRIASDAAKLVQLMNVEKKYIDTAITTNDTQFSQSGYYATEITPVVSQGITSSTRNGNSIKLVSARIDFQVKADTLCVNGLRYKWFIVCVKDNSNVPSSGAVTQRCFDTNIFGSYYDYHSQRDPDFYKLFQIVAKGGGKLMADSISGQAGINQFSKNLKLNHHLKYDSNSATATTQNAMHLIVFADTGTNAGTTGGLLSWSSRFWYVDN